jgi:hypothetical protein
MSYDEYVLGVISIAVSIIAIVVSIVVSLVALRLSNRESRKIAREYGDLAGTKAAIRYEEEKAAKARSVALHSLLNEIARIREFAIQNSKLEPRGRHQNAIKMPVTALETAFLSKESVLLDRMMDEPGLFAAAKAYLSEAYFINAQIDFFLSVSGALANPNVSEMMVHAMSQVRDRSHSMIEVLNQLEGNLKQISRALD